MGRGKTRSPPGRNKDVTIIFRVREKELAKFRRQVKPRIGTYGSSNLLARQVFLDYANGRLVQIPGVSETVALSD